MSFKIRQTTPKVIRLTTDPTSSGIPLVDNTEPSYPLIKSLVPGIGIEIKEGPQDILISSNAGGGVASVDNSPSVGGLELVDNTDPSNPLIRRLVQGDGVILQLAAGDISISTDEVISIKETTAFQFVNTEFETPGINYANKWVELRKGRYVQWTMSLRLRNISSSFTAYTVKIPTLEATVPGTISAVGNGFSGGINFCAVAGITTIDPGFINITMATSTNTNFVATASPHSLNLRVTFIEEEV